MITRQPLSTMAFILLTALVIFASYHPVFGLKGYESTTLMVSLSLAFLLCTFILIKTKNTKLYPLSPISFSLILFLGWAVLGNFYTVDQDNSMTATLQHFGGAILLLGLSLNIKGEEHLKRFLWLVLLCAGPIIAIAVLQQFEVFRVMIPRAAEQMNIGYYDRVNISTGFYGHKNILATYLLLHFPLAIYFYFSSQTRKIKIFTGILSILIVLAIIFTRSRGGQIVLGIQLLCILVYFIRMREHAKTRDFFIGGGLAAALYFGLFFLSIANEPPVPTISGVDIKAWQGNPSIADVFTGELNAWRHLTNRLVFWQTGWAIFKDYWLTGTGPWTFELLFPVYFGEETSGLVEGFIYSFWTANPPHSHNIFIQTATEMGVIGLGFFLVFLITIYSRGIFLLRNASPEIRNFVFFLILSVTGFMIHNQIEYNWIQIHFIYPFIFLVFAMDFLDRKYCPRKSSVKKINSLIHNGVLTAFVLLGTLSTANYYKYQALIYEKIIPSTGVANLRLLTNEVKTYCPNCGWPGLEMAKNLIRQYRLNGNPALLESAETELKEVALITPFNFRRFIYLAEIRSFQKNFGDAKRLYDQAFKSLKMKQLHACRVLSSNPDKC